MDTRTSSGFAVALRLRDATNLHDLDALVGCFALDFENETPAHPARSFRGRDQVRKNWAQIFAGVPDIETVPLRPHVLKDLEANVFLQHDLNVYNFIIQLNIALRAASVPASKRTRCLSPSTDVFIRCG